MSKPYYSVTFMTGCRTMGHIIGAWRKDINYQAYYYKPHSDKAIRKDFKFIFFAYRWLMRQWKNEKQD